MISPGAAALTNWRLLMARSYEVISADSHLEIDSARWIGHVPAQLRDRVPRLIRLPNGADAWMAEGRPLRMNGLNLAGGIAAEELSPVHGRYEDAAGAGPPEQRLQEQDVDGIDAEVLFTGVSGPDLWRGVKSDVIYKTIVGAYNNFLATEYCAVDADRLIGLGVIPETGVDDAVAEIEHCAELGLKGVTLNSFPGGKAFPTPDDDRFWAAAVDLRMPVTVHVEFGFPATTYGGTSGPVFQYPLVPEEGLTGGMDVLPRFNKYGIRGSLHACQLIWAGVFDRFPSLRLFFAETQIGWLPNFLELMDQHYLRNRFWVHRMLGMAPLSQLPSDYVREHCYWGFQYNPVGVRAVRQEIGVDRVMWATDFPHMESDWPNSQQALSANFDGIPDEERAKMVCGNAVEFFHLGE